MFIPYMPSCLPSAVFLSPLQTACLFFAPFPTQHMLPLLIAGGSSGPKEHPFSIVANLSSRSGSINDNHLGGFYSYRASKAALNQCMLICVVDIHCDRVNSHRQCEVQLTYLGHTVWLGIHLKDVALLSHAFVHSSYWQ